MTREELKQLLPIMQEFANGKTIQFATTEGTWKDLEKPLWTYNPEAYRVKPKSAYRPFKNKEECWNEMLKHQPFGWVKDKDKYMQIVSVFDDVVEFTPEEDCIKEYITKRCFMSFKEVLDLEYTFIDNSPFGIKEHAL